MFQRLGAPSKNLDDGELVTLPYLVQDVTPVDSSFYCTATGISAFGATSDDKNKIHEHDENDAPSLQDAATSENIS